jgi:hypothetical protein
VSKYAKGPAPINEPDFFSRLEPFEHRACRDYLCSQEIVRLQRILKRDPQAHQYTLTVLDLDGPIDRDTPFNLRTIIRYRRPYEWLLMTRVIVIRKAWSVGKNFTSTPVAGNPMWFNHPATRMMVLWPEWSEKPYWEIPPQERLRRIEAFEVPLNEKDQWVASEYLLNPHNPLTRKKMVTEIAICPDSLTLQEHHEAFDALLRFYAPELFQGVKAPRAKRGGRGSEEGRVLDDLNAFAAYQLCRVQNLPRNRAIKVICYPKGHKDEGQPVYSKTNELTRPLQRFPHLLQEFCAELMGNLVPLRPDLSGSQPDFSLL